MTLVISLLTPPQCLLLYAKVGILPALNVLQRQEKPLRQGGDKEVTITMEIPGKKA